MAGFIIGFGMGVYFLPILTAEKLLSKKELAELTSSAQAQTEAPSQLRQGTFVRDVEGQVLFTGEMIPFMSAMSASGWMVR